MPGRIQVRRRRAQRTVPFRLRKHPWVDPYPMIPGTEPEKRMFEALVRSRIFFVFQGQIPELERGAFVTLSIPGYKPDFVIPEYKVIIDPFSPFHHSLAEAVERDAQKVALYTAFGYTYYHPWAIAPGVFLLDQQRLKRVKRGTSFRLKDAGTLRSKAGSAYDVIAEIVEFKHGKKRKLTPKQQKLARNPGYELGPYLGAGANSVAAANRARTRPKPLALKRGTRRRKRGRSL